MLGHRTTTSVVKNGDPQNSNWCDLLHTTTHTTTPVTHMQIILNLILVNFYLREFELSHAAAAAGAATHYHSGESFMGAKYIV